MSEFITNLVRDLNQEVKTLKAQNKDQQNMLNSLNRELTSVWAAIRHLQNGTKL